MEVLEEREVDLEEGKETAAVTAAAMVVMMKRKRRRGGKEAPFRG